MPRAVLLALAARASLAATALTGPFDDSAASYDLVANGGMETHSGTVLSSWTDHSAGRLGWDNRLSYAGGASGGLLDQTWTCAGAGITLVQPASVTPGARYVLSGYVYNSLSGGNAYLDLNDQAYAQDDGGLGDCTSTSGAGVSAWQFVYCGFTVPTGSSSVVVRFVVDGSVGAGSYAWFDEFSLTPAATFNPPESLSADGDGDGWAEVDGDCDDADSSIGPGADETCGGGDEDCDGVVDEDSAIDAATWHPDGDSDGWGDATVTLRACTAPSGALADGSDCDDHDAAVSPSATERCDGYDDDCDGAVDEADAFDATTWYHDADGDGFGDPLDSTRACTLPPHHVADGTDCDDANGSAFPGALETWYDGIDQDCDGNDSDQDGDGWLLGLDCDDVDPAVNPDAAEVWYDGVDQDCDGASDHDRDGDGWDSGSHGGEDCDDGDPDTFPGAPDAPYDGAANDCDPHDEYDADGDGHDSDRHGGDDCDDFASDVHPGAAEVWYDGVDQDCDGDDDDQDGDGWPLAEDCDDADPTAWPGAPGWSEDCEPLGDEPGEPDSDVSPDTGPLPPDRYMGGGGLRCAARSGAGWLLLALLGLAGLLRRPSA